ncbi:MAG TPA: SAF domain-containing protein [Natronosporangium sp.]
MSQTNAPTGPARVQAGPVPAPSGPRERRVRFGHLALAIALIVVGALGTATLVLSVTAEGTYLVAAREIPYGKRFAAEDLVTVRLNNSPDVNAVSADNLDRVIGNYAAYSIPQGALLSSDHVTATQFPAPGQVMIGITLSADRLPSFDLTPGYSVRLVDTTDPDTAGTGQEASTQAPLSWQALVVDVDRGDSGDLFGGGGDDWTIDVVVNERDADLIARLAANDNLYVTILPGESGG